MSKTWDKAKKAMKDPDVAKSFGNDITKFVILILRIAIIVGVAYVIISPVIGIFVNSISSNKDCYNPMVFILPQFPTTERYSLAMERLNYWPTLGRDLLYTVTLTLIQLFVCSMVGYGFARFEFPLKKLLFGLVVVMIVIPSHTIMLPVYMTFMSFDPFGIVTDISGTPGIMGTVWPMYIMTFFGCGLRSGLFIYIFNQFFRGLPKEIEEAALVDGCGTWYTYFNIMLRNAMPAVITVTVFSIVWQFNDIFYANLFLVSDDIVISKKVASLQLTIANQDKILDKAIQELYLDAGIMLIILPVVIIYIALQKYFIEGVERSGIVG